MPAANLLEQQISRIEEFGRGAAAREYTDTNDLWDLFHDLRDAIKPIVKGKVLDGYDQFLMNTFLQRVDNFDQACEASGYTDTGKAWEILDAYVEQGRAALAGAMPNLNLAVFQLEDVPNVEEDEENDAAP